MVEEVFGTLGSTVEVPTIHFYVSKAFKNKEAEINGKIGRT